jgi:Immunoglobulin I-set domain
MILTDRISAEPPSFIEEPKRIMKASLGRSTTLACRVFGAPKPTIVWQKGINLEDVEGYYDRRYTKLSNGDLEIQVNYTSHRTCTVIEH